MLTLAKYKRDQMQAAGVSPEYIEAVMLQDDIRSLKDTLRKKENRYKTLIANLAGTQDEVYTVTDLKPIRTVDKHDRQEHLPEAYAATIGLTSTDVGKAMQDAYSREEINALIQSGNPTFWEAKSRVTVGDLEKFLGKKEVKKLDGTAIHTTMQSTGKSRLVLRHPRKYPELAEPEEEEDE